MCDEIPLGNERAGHLAVGYDNRPLIENIDFSLKRGEILTLIGPNGAGKSTILKSIARQLSLVSGTIYLDKSDVVTMNGNEFAKKMAVVLTDKLKTELMTCYDVVATGRYPYTGRFGVLSDEDKKAVDEAMELVNVSQIKDKDFTKISDGQRQRVMLSRAICQQPEIIVLDEPTSQLDPAGSEEVFAAVDKLAKSGITIIMVEQKLEKLAEYCDKILLLHQGKQIAFDTPEQIFSRADLQNYGVNLPAYTRICQAFGVKKENGCYPASLKDALALKDLFPGEEAFCCGKKSLDDNTERKNEREKIVNSVTTDESMKLTISCKKNVFDIEHLEFQYLENVPVLQDINLTIDHRPTAIIGQNGAGKTTLVKLLKGLLRPVGGSIYYGGSDMAEKTVAMLAGEIGYVFQNPDDQIFKYHVIDEVMFGPQNIGMTKEQAKEKAVAALKLVGLEQLVDENPYDLELSERKLVAIASVLAMDTKVLILDEPTIAQDWKGRKIIQKMIRDLSSQGKTVIAILHDMDFVAESFERVIVMAHGKVLADGTKEEVFAQKDVLEQARIDQPYLTKLCQQLGYKKLYFSLKD